MKNIAIISYADRYSNIAEDYERIAHSISEWKEVSDEDYSFILEAAYKNNMVVICREDYPIANFDYQQLINQGKGIVQKRQEDKIKREQAEIKRKEKLKSKEYAKKLELFNKLKEELKT